MKFFAVILLVAGYCMCANAHAQQPAPKLDNINRSYNALVENTNTEKVVLQTDRKVYIAGEKIWFTAKTVNTLTQKISQQNKNLFVDLVDDKDSAIAKLVLDNRQATTNGAINLPEDIITGFYWMRSYTAAILATDTGNITIQPVYILNTRLHDEAVYNKQFISKVNKSASQPPIIHFFPERLTALPGIISTGVLQITDENNSPLIVAGSLVNSNNVAIANFTTNQLGLARINFLNEANEKYTAIFSVNGKAIPYALPPAEKAAAQLSVANQTANSIKLFITLEEGLPENAKATVLGVHGDSLCYAAIGAGTYGTTISLDNFPGGIASFLLFNEQQELLAERKIFINKNNYQLNIQADKLNYGVRDSVNLAISLNKPDGTPIQTSLAIAVQDARLTVFTDSIGVHHLPPLDQSQLAQWLAANHNNYSAADIDLLMMAIPALQKNAIATKNANTTSGLDDDTKILSLIGKITTKKGKPEPNLVVTVLTKNTNSFFTDFDITKPNGSFEIPLPQNMDSLLLSMQVMDKYKFVRTDEYITLDTFNYPQFATPVYLKQQFMAANSNTLIAMRKRNIDTVLAYQGRGWLKPVIVTAVAKPELNYDASKRINSISQILTSDKFRYGGKDAVTNALLMVPGVSLMSDGNITIFGAMSMGPNADTRPLVVVDGIAQGPLGAGSLDLNPADIDFIEVLRGGEAGIFGNRAGNGVISINTRHGPPRVLNAKSNFRIIAPLTYHLNAAFFMPDYTSSEQKNNTQPDPRSTIYWNSDLATDTAGKATVHFYTADNTATYTVTVTGITADGEMIYKRITINRN
ncbi:TonB-dependent receptor [Limnovirga soli]|uniref:TonB-dependent receptor plug domain-containing protein n=1 Tax=Limnovirga soli TaxID=2656915 RepID=A0A8J8F9G6_9BACT|nr:TonB-dependent receptor plug domain-containing protein [Limnovirga soli]NNV53970.1 TonB-dependent receptor plug domain-containing protein [Limnovirga soli]